MSLDLDGRPVVVVGGGRVALGKVRGLLACGASVTVIAPDVCQELAELDVSVRRRAYRSGDLTGFALVFTATDDPAVNGAVSADAQAAGTWVNSADDPARCTFQLPAVVRRGPMTVAVSSSGRSPASPIAASVASSARLIPLRPDPRPVSDRPMPETITRDSNFSITDSVAG